LDLAAVLDFVDSGHDLIIAADSSSSDLIKSLATECGVDFDEVGVEFMMHWIFCHFILFIEFILYCRIHLPWLLTIKVMLSLRLRVIIH